MRRKLRGAPRGGPAPRQGSRRGCTTRSNLSLDTPRGGPYSVARMKMVLKLSSFVPALALLAGCASRPAGDAAADTVWVEREAYLMGTTLRGRVLAPTRAAGLAALERAFAEVRRQEALLSSWRGDAELARVNGAPPGVPVRPTPELFALLAEARAWSDSTGAAFDPTVGALVDAWGLRGAGRRPAEAELRRAREASGWRRFALDAAAGTVVRRDSLAWIDTGGFGKGAALRGVERVLEREGTRAALFDFGGQVLAVGAPPGEAAWPVAAAHPARRQEPAAELRLRGRSASTSSASERWVEEGGERLGHVLDPRTGRPVPAWGSVTVVARDPLAADALSTALFVMGPEEGMRWARERQDVGVLFLVERGGVVEARWNAGLEPYRVAR